eukprot:678444_1
MVLTLVLSALYAIHTIHGADFTFFVELNGGLKNKNWGAAEKTCTVDNDATMIAPSEIYLVTECASLIPGTNPGARAWIGEAGDSNAYVVKKGDTPLQKQGKNSVSPRLTGVCCAPRFLREFEARRDILIDVGEHVILEAYDGEPLNVSSSSPFDNALKEVDESKSNSEYGLATLVRILYFTEAEYGDEIKAAVKPLEPFWVHNGDMTHYFWRESNMILWSSAAYLLKQRFSDLNVGDTADLANRLETLLRLKKEHGFFQVNSAVSTPHVMNALLNLADFSDDETIAGLAVDALQLLLKEFVDNVNNQGAFYPAQATSKDDKMKNPYNQGVFKISHLLTGKGPDVVAASRFDAFLATTSVHHLAGVLGTWQSKIDGKTTIHGIPYFEDNSLNNYDAIAFNLSAGLFWTPEVVEDTIAFVDYYGLTEHPEFAPYYDMFHDPEALHLSHAALVPLSLTLHAELVPLSRGRAINRITSVLFKDGPVMLSSFQDYNPRFLGFEQYPFVATTGILSVYAKSGGGSKLSNIHLPYIKQEKNAALIKYDSTLIAHYAHILDDFGVTDYKTVTFFFPKSKFGEVRASSNWILGEENGGYVALWRACNNDVVNDKITCDDDQQVYAVFVGCENEYGDFGAFENVVTRATMASSVDGTKAIHTLTINGLSLTIETATATATATAAKSPGIVDMMKSLDFVPDDGIDGVDDSNRYFMPLFLFGCWCVVVLMLYCAAEYRKKSNKGWQRVNKGLESDEDEMLFADSL